MIFEILYYKGGHKNMYIDTKLKDFQLRFATKEDVSLILSLIKELAHYEKMSDEVKATEELLLENLFHQKKAEVIIGEYQHKPVAFALFFHNFSTFEGKPGIYLEDLYVKPQMRGKGIGSILVSFLATLAQERNCARVEWTCLNWNEPSIQFYLSCGAEPMDEWTIYRLDSKNIDHLANKWRPTMS